jgi:hypothetical protein
MPLTATQWVYRWLPLSVILLLMGLVMFKCGHSSFDDFMNN